MIIADTGSYSSVFNEWKFNMPKQDEFSLEALLYFWHPEWSRYDIPHPLAIVVSLERFIHEDTTATSPMILRKAWEQGNREILAILDTMTPSQESAYWHNHIKEEWEQVEQKIDDFAAQTWWGVFGIHKEKFLRGMEREFVKYKTMALNLFALRRTGELVRTAHLYQNFQEPKAIIKQWLQPDWEVNALQHIERTEGRRTVDSLPTDRDFLPLACFATVDSLPTDRAFSPLDYFAMLAGKSVLINPGENDKITDEETYLTDLFFNDICLNKTEREAWLFWGERPHTHTGWPDTRREATAVKGNRMAHELFTMVFSCVNVGRFEEKTGFWLTAPNAACFQMWLDLEQEFQQDILGRIPPKNMLACKIYDYQLPQRGRLHNTWEKFQQKLELNLRLAVKHKETMPENYAHWQTILSSHEYKKMVDTISSVYVHSESAPHQREYLLRYGLDWPFLEGGHLPYTQGLVCALKGRAGTYRLLDNTLMAELSWRIGAADMRVRAELSTPEEELAAFLRAITLARPEIACDDILSQSEIFPTCSLSGNKNEIWYLHLHHAYTEKWGRSQDDWDDLILEQGISTELPASNRSLIQYWLSAEKWDFFREVKRNHPDLTENVLRVLDTVTAEEHLLLCPDSLKSLSSKHVGEMDEIFPGDAYFLEHLNTGLSFIRFNAVLAKITEVIPSLGNVRHLPVSENISFTINYIIKKFPERYCNVDCPYNERMQNVVTELEQEAVKLLGYIENEITETTDFGDMVF